ncbi:MAG TPA: DUF4126 domain-containing protein, partial [Longimicrobium sp.]|nr:DUF4126 domain-containing protein [Longimicrobium sp.]
PLPPALEWMARPTAILLFGVATLLELLGDKVPFIDHALDAVQVVVKPGLAVLASVPFLYQLSPEFSVAIGIILGAPLALGVHTAKATVRVGSSATTAGVANPLLSVFEDIAAIGAIIVGFLAPFLALLLTLGFLVLLFRMARRLRRAMRRRTTPA